MECIFVIAQLFLSFSIREGIFFLLDFAKQKVLLSTRIYLSTIVAKNIVIFCQNATFHALNNVESLRQLHFTQHCTGRGEGGSSEENEKKI